MKRALFTIALLLQCLYLFSQSSVIQVKQDSVKIRNAELVIESRTKGTPGVLYNIGDGRTEFRRIELKNLGDTALAIVGQDTLKYSGLGGASGKSVQFKTGASQGYPVAGDSIYTNPDFTGKNLKVWRNGSFQYRDLSDGVLVDSTIGKITFRPALTQGERVYIEAMSGISLVFIYPPAGFFTNLTQLNAGAFDHGNNTFTLRWATNNNTLSLSPRVVGLGSSTLAGYGLNSPDRLGDKIGAWFNSNTSGASWNNLAVGGYSSVNLMPVSQGGTAGTNIDSALKYNPDFLFISLPSNDVGNGLSNAQILANLKKLDTMALNKGIPILWETTQPRHQLNAAQQTQLKVIADSIRAIWPKRFVEGFNNIVDATASTDAVIKTEYSYGDGVHLNAQGVLQIASSLFARFQSYFQPIIGVSGYVVEASTNGSSWSQFDEVTNPVIVKKSYTKPSGGIQYFRVKANYTNGTSSPYSNIATYFGNGGGTTPPVTGDPNRILVDLGGDSVNTWGGGIPIGQTTISPDAAGNYWNNWYGSGGATGFRDNSTISNLVTANNTATSISFKMIGEPSGNQVQTNGTSGINAAGFYSSAGGYPGTALSDNMFLHNSINPNGTTLRIEGLTTSKTYSIKLWGARVDPANSASRILESKLGTEGTWANSKTMETYYGSGTTPDFNRAIVYSGITGTSTLDINLRPGGSSTYAHVSFVDISIADAPGTPTVFVTDASITLPTNSVALTGNVNANGSTITGYQWTQISGPNTATMGTNTAVNCTMSGLVSGSYVFRLTVTVSGGATYSDDATVTVNAATAPTISVADATITLPTNSVALTGTITANGNTFTGYQWTQVSGPNTATMGTPTATSCTMGGLTNGVYVFRLTGTVTGGATYSDDATVTVNASSGTAPTITVADASITLPTSSVSLTSTINANGNTITGYQWTQLPLTPYPGEGGPNAVTFGTATAANTTVSALTNGVFKVRLTVTVSGGATYSDDATITVLPDNGGLKTLRVYFSNAAAPVIPGWMNVYGAVTGMNISVTDPTTSWTINNGGNTSIYWTGLTGVNSADNAGMRTNNNTGVVPDIALNSYWFNYSLKYSTNDNLLITGLNPSKTYTLKLVGSRSSATATAPRYAAWRINGGSELLQNALGNTSAQEVVTGVVPNSSGVIRIAVYPPVNHTTNGEFSYINALIIQEN